MMLTLQRKKIGMVTLGMGCLLVLGACSSSEPKNSDAAALEQSKEDKSNSEEAEKAAQNAEGAPQDQAQAVHPISASGGVNNDFYKHFNDARASHNNKLIQDAAGEILARNPSDVRVLNALAVEAINQEKYEQARLLVAKVLEKDPNNGAAYNNLGVVELKSDNLRLALTQFKKATELDQKNKAAHANLGTIYLQYRNYASAAAELDAAVSAGDQSPATLSNLGFALAEGGDVDRARKMYEKAMSRSGNNNVNIMLNYAVLLVERAHDKKEAIKVLNKIQFVAHEPAILNKVDALLRKAEAPAESAAPSTGSAKGTGKGDLQ